MAVNRFAPPHQALPPAYEAWRNYQEIEYVVTTRYKLLEPANATQHPAISQAVQRLGMAVIRCHQLEGKKLLINVWPIQLKAADSLDTDAPPIVDGLPSRPLALLTTDNMIHAHVSTWVEDARNQAKVQSQPSLHEALGRDYHQLKVVVNTQPEHALHLLQRIAQVVRAELEMMAIQNSSPHLSKEINAAVARLHPAVLHKYNQPVPTDALMPNIDLNYVDSIDLYSYDTMLNAAFPEWEPSIPSFSTLGACMGQEEGYKPTRSLREALNLTFSPVIGLHPSLFGKTAALRNVTTALVGDLERALAAYRSPCFIQ